MCRLVDSDKHAVDRRLRRHSESHCDVTARQDAAIILNRSGNWKMGRNDHVLHIERSFLASHPPAAAGVDRSDTRVLEDAAASRFDRQRKPNEVLDRIELRLISKAKRGGGIER